MKKIAIILGILFLGNIAFCEESTSIATQELIKENNKATITFMKQPTNENNSQKVVVKGNWFCINIIDNGKVPFNSSSNR